MLDPTAIPPAPLSLRRITAQQRQQLQQSWQAGQRQVANPRTRSSGLRQLAGCVQSDPGNRFYVETFLQVTGALPSRWPLRLSPWRARHRWRKTVSEQRWGDVLQDGPSLLIAFPHWAPLCLGLAEACRRARLPEAERAYVTHASRVASDDPTARRKLAEFLMRAADFSNAALAWERVLELDADDPQARWAYDLVRDSSAEQSSTQSYLGSLPERLAADPAGIEQAVQETRRWLDQGWLEAARGALAITRSAAPGDWRLIELSEDWTLARAQRDLELMRDWTDRVSDPDASWLVWQAQGNQQRVILQVVSTRAERHPADPSAQWRLAEQLHRGGRWSQGAELAAALAHHPQWSAAAGLLRGECLQQMRRFSQALQCYRSALEQAHLLDDASRLRLWYREAILSEAVGDWEAARRGLEALVQAAPDYRDAAARLDKLERMRHKD